jgi:hypothetical protein
MNTPSIVYLGFMALTKTHTTSINSQKNDISRKNTNLFVSCVGFVVVVAAAKLAIAYED